MSTNFPPTVRACVIINEPWNECFIKKLVWLKQKHLRHYFSNKLIVYGWCLGTRYYQHLKQVSSNHCADNWVLPQVQIRRTHCKGQSSWRMTAMREVQNLARQNTWLTMRQHLGRHLQILDMRSRKTGTNFAPCKPVDN